MATKISIVIPNYNGKSLLEKNLPNVIKNSPDCEIIVVDDSSTDDSVEYLRKKFKKVKTIQQTKNEGFAKAANRGVKNSDGEYVALINSDVSPQKDYLSKALSNFENNNSLFAVGFADLSHEEGRVVTRGRGGAIFKRGFITHFAIAPQKGETLWVSGGSALFDKNKFFALGGFDAIYAPFYWEDIDLSFRARLRGYTCLYEPKSKVDHFHEEGIIKKTKSPLLIKTVSYKNQFLFVWKNVSDPILLALHIFWQPYHFTRALVFMDLAFFAGFLWALAKIPNLIFNYDLQTTTYRLSDREVLEKFAKQ